MTDTARGAPFARIPHSKTPRLSRLFVAGLMATTVLAATSVAQARITKIQIQTRGTAFGGHSFANVGQYEFITGVATGEVDPRNPQNGVITDIALADRLPNGHVQYRHNFYILQPLDFSKGNRKMMYEPPNRGGKTYQTLNNTPTGTDDPAALTDPTALDDSFLWTRGYTTVWSGWENNLVPSLDDPTALTASATFPVVHNANGSTVTGPGYEYIVTTAQTPPKLPTNVSALAYPAASGDKSTATLTHRVHLDDPHDVVPSSGWAYTDATNTAIKLVPGPFVSQRHL